MKKLEKLRVPGPAANIGESIAKEIGTIELLVLEIWLSQFLPVNMCQFCVYLCFDKFYANSNNGLYLILTYCYLILAYIYRSANLVFPSSRAATAGSAGPSEPRPSLRLRERRRSSR